VQRQRLEPPRVEHQDGVLDLATCPYVEAGLKEQSGADGGRRGQLERGGAVRISDLVNLRGLPEDVEEREHRNDADEPEQQVRKPPLVRPSLPVALAAE